MGCETLKPGAPKYGINETVYVRASALRGYVEPLIVNNVWLDIPTGQYNYNFKRDLGNYDGSNLLLPITLLESELITLCEALDIQVPVLERQLAEAQAQFAALCVKGEDLPYVPEPVERKSVVNPTKPRFAFSDIVYLIESAQTVGRLESYRVDGIKWEPTMKQWLYSFDIKKRPGRSTTVGDRDDLSRSMVLYYAESELCTVCEAMPLVVKFMQKAVDLAVKRRESLCPASARE